MASAVRQWRLLRHLVSLAVAVVTEFGFSITPLCIVLHCHRALSRCSTILVVIESFDC
jgi:hypothetical protein